jgi:hypothetical protein
MQFLKKGIKRGERKKVNILWSPNNGNAPANIVLVNVLAAIALAAYNGYASTRKVKTPEKTRNMLKFQY